MIICKDIVSFDRFTTGRAHGIESTDALANGVNLMVGNKELEIDHFVARADFMSGECFQNGGAGCSSQISVSSTSGALSRPYAPLRPKTISGFKPPTRVVDPTSSRKIVELEAVDLVQGDKPPAKSKPHDSFWTANW